MAYLPDKRALSTKEAAACLGLSPGTLEVWRSKGKGPRFRKHGRRVLYEIADLNSYSDSRIVETIDTAPKLKRDR
jgi:predicted site-specific integrase-resolvase